MKVYLFLWPNLLLYTTKYSGSYFAAISNPKFFFFDKLFFHSDAVCNKTKVNFLFIFVAQEKLSVSYSNYYIFFFDFPRIIFKFSKVCVLITRSVKDSFEYISVFLYAILFPEILVFSGIYLLDICLQV